MHHMEITHFSIFETIIIIVGLFSVMVYGSSVYVSYKKDRSWPAYRSFLFIAGIFSAVLPLAGPFAEIVHHNFIAHMAGHLFLGMLAPLLIAFSQPMTLLMRALKTNAARNLSKIMRSRYIQIISNPIIASILNIGGLYLIYMTGLFHWMHESVWLFALVHLHVFLAGYLFTISIIYVDLTSHRYSFAYRAVVLVLALGFHKILSKLIYAEPPAGVPIADGEYGAMLMYYGGDIIDFVLIIVLCYEWYQMRSKTSHTYSFFQ